MKLEPVLAPSLRGTRSADNAVHKENLRPAVTYDPAVPLLLKTAEVCRMLGGIHPRTLTRLESRGLIGPVSGLLRHKLYARRDVEALVESLSSWKPRTSAINSTRKRAGRSAKDSPQEKRTHHHPEKAEASC